MKLTIYPKLEDREAKLIKRIYADMAQIQATLDELIDDSEVDKDKLKTASKWLEKGFNALTRAVTNKTVCMLPQEELAQDGGIL